MPRCCERLGEVISRGIGKTRIAQVYINSKCSYFPFLILKTGCVTRAAFASGHVICRCGIGYSKSRLLLTSEL